MSRLRPAHGAPVVPHALPGMRILRRLRRLMPRESTMFELVKRLTELTGPTGYEDEVQAWVADAWRERGLRVERTPIGNLMARVGGTGPKLLIGAHADEICFRVKSVDEQGFVWLTAGRGMGEQRLPEPVPLGLVAEILTEACVVRGTFVTVTGHVMTRQQRGRPERHGRDWMDFYVDIGARTRADAEQIGLIGARSVAAGFDLGVIVEVGLAGDIPLVDRRQMPVSLGAGPIVVHKDMSLPYSAAPTRALIQVARAAGIPFQHAVFQNFASDGREWIQEGVPTAMVAFPCRYTHSPNETVDESDLARTVDLLRAFVTSRPDDRR